MRRRVTAATFLLFWLAIAAGAAEALPAKEYRAQENTRCMEWRGCPRLLRNAVSHAERFCREEGGVLRGGNNRDFRCEQRGIYCVVTGRIECRGRLDPTRRPGDAGGAAGDAQRARTCLDEGCRRFVSHAPGEIERGTHACPAGHLVAGVSGAGNNLVCQAVPRPALETIVETANRRMGLLACPPGMVVRGVSEDRTRLLCVRASLAVGEERVQDESGFLGLQACTDEQGEYSAQRLLTGVDPERQKILCATVTPR